MRDRRGTAAEQVALDEMYSLAYEELRRVAGRFRRSPAWTLSPTTLVNEAWLKLAASPAFRSTSPLHFKRIAAHAMRQVLVDAARRKAAQKRGGGEVVFATFDESLAPAAGTPQEFLRLHAALDELGEASSRQAQVVELRFFGGLEVSEVGALLGISEITVHRDWRLARAFLAGAMRQ